MSTQVDATVWIVPEKDAEVTISPAALADLLRDVGLRRNRAAGLFLATTAQEAGSHRVTVEHTIPLGDSADTAEGTELLSGIETLEDIILMWQESPRFPGPVGFYVVSEVEAGAFCQDQLPALKKYLKGATHLLLFVRIRGQEATGEMVLQREGDDELARRLIPLDVPAAPAAVPVGAGGAAAAPALAASPAQPERVIVPEPEPVRVAPVEARAAPAAAAPAVAARKRRIWWIPASAAALLLVAAVGYWAGQLRLGPAVTVAPQQAAAPPPTLGLRVARSGADLEVMWDNRAPMLQGAARGFLYINDGGQRTQVFLESADLRSGRVMYVPRSADIEVRLEIATAEDRLVRESVRVLQAGTAAPAASPRIRLTGEAAQQTRPPDVGRMLPAQQTAEVVEEPAERRVFLPPPDRTASPSGAVGTARIEQVPLPQLIAQPPAEVAARPLSLPASNPSAVLVPPPAPAAPAATTPSKPALVLTSTDRLAPVPTRQVPVRVPNTVRAMLQGEVTIEVKVQVDTSGRVTEATAPRQDTLVKTQLASLARESAVRWQFDPATRAGRPIASSYTLVFRFRR